jgi:cobalt-zinc-cadmium efflux system protein
MSEGSIKHQQDVATKRKISVQNRLELSLAIAVVVLLVELAGGFEFGSSALLADALHVFTDIFAIGFSLFALTLSSRPPTRTLTYGYHRVEVFASLINGVSLFAIAAIIGLGAYLKFAAHTPINVPGTVIVAVAALALNMVSRRILSGSPSVASNADAPYLVDEDLNVKSATTHVYGDALASLAVIAGAALVYATHDYVFDPIVAVFIGLIVLRSAIATTWAGLSIMLERSPVKDMPELEAELEKVNGISDVHDLHVWKICSHITIATLHACLNDQGRTRRAETMGELEGKLTNSYGVQHATIQLEDVCCVPRHGHL